MCIRLHVKHPLFLSDFNETGTFSTNFRKLLKYEISRQSVQWESSSSTLTVSRTDGRTNRLTDRQTDMTKVIAGLRNSANATKKELQETGNMEVMDCHCISSCHLKP